MRDRQLRPRTIEILADLEVGEIARLDIGLVLVGPRIAGEHLCRLVERCEDGFREVSEPMHLADRSRVLELVRDQSYYLGRRAGGGTVDPVDRGSR